MADDRTVLLKQRAQQASAKYALLREGLEPEITDDALGVLSWRPARDIERSRTRETGDDIPFHVPMTRAHRLTSADGATSFHFAHSFINKVSTERMEDGRRNRPGAARAHGRYVERETAVASVAATVEPAITASPSTTPAKVASVEENDHEREEDGTAAGRTGGRSEGTDAGRPFLQRNLEILGDYPSGIDAEPGTDLRLLSGFELVRAGRHPELLVQGIAPVSVDAGPVVAAVRQPQSRPAGNARAGTAIGRQTPSGHDRYIVRGGAVAIQPDGDLALFTNIDADPARRAEFWTQVEAHERTAGADQMSCRFADRPAFWTAAVRQNDCPPALRDTYARADHHETVRFDIDSGKAMRKFLERQAGWAANDAATQVPVKFHDGRAGRTQYRIVGELPDELSMAARIQLLRDFTEEFRNRRIPFVAVMHAPDHNNDEKNWHFHIIYYDRPCARITAAQIAELERNGYDTGRLSPGMWDFAAATVKKDRVNRELFPLRQKKVAHVGNDRWIKDLRHRFAALTNVQLEKADVARWVDPRRHADMGILADPQEHLGTRQAAAEARGVATAAGTRNEERQSQAILAQIDQTHARAVAAVVDRVADWKRRLAGKPVTDRADPVAAVERNLIAAADLDRLAAMLRHDDDRAASRATNLKRMNGQLVRAIDADRSAGSRREREHRAGIVAGADRYLHMLDAACRDDRQLIAECAAEAGRHREAARLAEATLEEMARVPAVAPQPVVKAGPRPQPSSIDPLERWLRQVEQGRPLIVTESKRFTLAGIKSPAGIDAAPAQARLATLYGRQQEEIADVVRQLPVNRLSIGKRQIEGRSRYYLDGVDPELARTFLRYQDSPEISAAIDRIVRPELAGRSVAVRQPPPLIQRPVVTREPVAAPVPAPQPAREPYVRQVAAVVPTPRSMAPPLGNRPPTAPARPVVAASGRIAAVPTPPNTAEVARDLVARNVPLTLDEDYLINRAALLEAKVDPEIITALQNNPVLAARTSRQVEQALEQLQDYARTNPTNLIRKGEHISLGGDAPAALIELARFHSRAPRMQERLRNLHDELNAPAAASPTPARTPVINPPQPAKVEPPSKEEPVPPAKADILHGDAARQAAVRAAWQRGR